MQGFYTHGPWCTYVTDPSLGMKQQQRIIEGFVACSGDQNLRVAFRYPNLEEDEIRPLLEWYLRLVDTSGALMLPPLVHGATNLAARFPEVGLWLPSRLLDSPPEFGGWTAASVHSYEEAKRAVDSGAHELIYGHIFETSSHAGEDPRGLTEFRLIADELRRTFFDPVITGIGGIHEGKAAEIGRSRMFSIAMIRGISHSQDVAATLKGIRDAWLWALVRADLDEPELNDYSRPSSIYHRWTSDSDHYVRVSMEQNTDE